MNRKHLLTPAVALALLAGAAAPALADQGVTEHPSAALTDVGGTIACGPLELTPVAGTLDGVFHESVDGQGRYHYSGTNVVHDAVLVDGAGRAYALHGTSSFSGTSTDPEGIDNIAFRTQVSLTVTRADGGGRVGMVKLLERVGPAGQVELTSGGCAGVGGIQ